MVAPTRSAIDNVSCGAKSIRSSGCTGNAAADLVLSKRRLGVVQLQGCEEPGQAVLAALCGG